MLLNDVGPLLIAVQFQLLLYCDCCPAKLAYTLICCCCHKEYFNRLYTFGSCCHRECLNRLHTFGWQSQAVRIVFIEYLMMVDYEGIKPALKCILGGP